MHILFHLVLTTIYEVGTIIIYNLPLLEMRKQAQNKFS